MSRSAWNDASCGTLSSSTMIVMRIAITPSLNASSRPFFIAELCHGPACRGNRTTASVYQIREEVANESDEFDARQSCRIRADGGDSDAPGEGADPGHARRRGMVERQSRDGVQRARRHVDE